MNANTNTSRCMAEMNSVLEVAQPRFSPTPIENKRRESVPNGVALSCSEQDA